MHDASNRHGRCSWEGTEPILDDAFAPTLAAVRDDRDDAHTIGPCSARTVPNDATGERGATRERTPAKVRDATDADRYVIGARLKAGQAAAAERALQAGPPFDPVEAGLSGHAAYLTDDAVYLVFEGELAHVKALQLAREHLVDVSYWQSIVSGLPSRVADVPPNARCLYRWSSEG
jgi:hypothetical protein